MTSPASRPRVKCPRAPAPVSGPDADAAPDFTGDRPACMKDRRLLKCQYFLYFSILGIFLPYFSLYLYHLGFSEARIGVILSARSLTTVVFSLIWAVLADRLKSRRPIFRLCACAAAVFWAGFLDVTGFLPILLLTVCHGIFHGPIISFTEAYAMDLLGPDRSAYGRVRVWGTVSFILVVTAAGQLCERSGIKIIVPVILGLSMAQAVLSFRFPPIPVRRKLRLSGAGPLFGNRETVLFLAGGFFMLAGHGAYYGFFSIHLEELGCSPGFMAVSWVAAVSVEIIIMLHSRWITHRFRLEILLIFSCVMAVVRWLLLAFFTGIHMILASQLLHAFTYGSFHIAGILWISRRMPAEAGTLGQAVNNSLSYGLGMMAGSCISGRVLEDAGSRAMFLISAGMAAAAVLSFLWMAADGNRLAEEEDDADSIS